jgi:hypothetical protein
MAPRGFAARAPGSKPAPSARAPQGPSDDSKRQVESLLVVSERYGELRLDREPDVRLALQLSADLRLDEVLCVELLMAAQERTVLTYEAAAGVYFNDRCGPAEWMAPSDTPFSGPGSRSAPGSGRIARWQMPAHRPPPAAPLPPRRLLFAKGVADLLAMVALNRLEQHHYQEAVSSFVQSLLAERRGGRSVLVSQLLACIKDNRLESPAAGCPQDVVDDRGVRISRRGFLLTERQHLTRALLYALAVSPLLPAADVAELLEVAGALADKVAAAGPHDAKGGRLGWRCCRGRERCRGEQRPAGGSLALPPWRCGSAHAAWLRPLSSPGSRDRRPLPHPCSPAPRAAAAGRQRDAVVRERHAAARHVRQRAGGGPGRGGGGRRRARARRA